MTTIDDPLVTARYISAIVDRVEAAGMSIELSGDFAALRKVCETTSGKPKVQELMSTAFFDVVPADGFWLCGRDAEGEVVHVQAMRRENLEGIDLWTHWHQQQRRLFEGPNPAVRLDGHYCPAAREMTGIVVYHGEFWIAPRLRGRGLAPCLSRLGFALALATWSPDFVYGFMGNGRALKGLAAQLGYLHAQPQSVGFAPPPEHLSEDYWLVWVERSDLEYLVRIPVA